MPNNFGPWFLQKPSSRDWVARVAQSLALKKSDFLAVRCALITDFPFSDLSFLFADCELPTLDLCLFGVNTNLYAGASFVSVFEMESFSSPPFDFCVLAFSDSEKTFLALDWILKYLNFNSPGFRGVVFFPDFFSPASLELERRGLSFSVLESFAEESGQSHTLVLIADQNNFRDKTEI